MMYLTQKSFSYPGVLIEWACAQKNKPSPSIPSKWIQNPSSSNGELLYGMMVFAIMRFCPEHLPFIISFFYKNKQRNKAQVLNDIYNHLVKSNLNNFLNDEIDKGNDKLIDYFIDMLRVPDSNNSYFQSQLMMLFFHYFIVNKNNYLITKIIKKSSPDSNTSQLVKELMDFILVNESFNNYHDKKITNSNCVGSIVSNFSFKNILDVVFPRWFDDIKREIKIVRDGKLKTLDYVFSHYQKNMLNNKDEKSIKKFFKDDFDYTDPANCVPHIKSFMEKSKLNEVLSSKNKDKKERLI